MIHPENNWFTYPSLYQSMVDRFASGAWFVEVGSWTGMSAAGMGRMIKESGKDIRLDCVDAWNPWRYPELFPISKSSAYWETVFELLTDWDSVYRSFLKNTESFKGIINHIKGRSIDAARLYPDRSIDFIFIDAGHEKEDVIEDATAWFPKIKKGGIMAGHDYYSHPGVRQAVDEFFGSDVELSEKENTWLVYL
jgi:hypothetical protein